MDVGQTNTSKEAPHQQSALIVLQGLLRPTPDHNRTEVTFMADIYGITTAGVTLSRNSDMSGPFFSMLVSSNKDRYVGQGSVTRTLVDDTTWLDLPDTAPDISQVLAHNSSGATISVSCLAASARAHFVAGSQVTFQRNANLRGEIVRSDGVFFEAPNQGWGPWQVKGPTSQYNLKSGITTVVARGFGASGDGAYEQFGSGENKLTLGTKRLFDMETGVPVEPISKLADQVSVIGLSPLTIILPPGQVTIIPGMYLRAGAHLQKSLDTPGAEYAVEFYCTS